MLKSDVDGNVFFQGFNFVDIYFSLCANFTGPGCMNFSPF